MPSRRFTLPAVAALAIASLALGVLAALASGRDPKPRVKVTHRPPTTARVVAQGNRVLWAMSPATAIYAGACRSAQKAPAAEPVPQNLLDAFGVLRRDPTPDDALPAAALTALRDRGLEPFDPAAARLLRTTSTGGHAWVVPVRDVADPAALGRPCILRDVRPVRPAVRKPLRVRPATPVVPKAEAAPKPAAPAPAPRTEAAPTPAPAPPVTPTTQAAPTAPAPAPPPPSVTTPTVPKTTPHPGLAVVALDGAPVGAGGRLEDLVRGREPVAIDACGGPNRDMLSVSGIVPDGVGAAFLTSADGTAVRADVKDNAYAFVVPRAKHPEERYVVWTGGDGTPHVQPLGFPVFAARGGRCATPPGHLPPTVSPDGSGLCGHYFRSPPIVIPRPSAHTPPRVVVPAPSPLLYRAPCAIAPGIVVASPTPPTVRIAPKAPHTPKRHR